MGGTATDKPIGQLFRQRHCNSQLELTGAARYCRAASRSSVRASEVLALSPTEIHIWRRLNSLCGAQTRSHPASERANQYIDHLPSGPNEASRRIQEVALSRQVPAN